MEEREPGLPRHGFGVLPEVFGYTQTYNRCEQQGGLLSQSYSCTRKRNNGCQRTVGSPV